MSSPDLVTLKLLAQVSRCLKAVQKSARDRDASDEMRLAKVRSGLYVLRCALELADEHVGKLSEETKP
jgi:hypothetical protein